MNKVGLIILDGVGFSKDKFGNAVVKAKMPNYKKLIKHNSILISASGKNVGLPSDEMPGNSEVGHNTIGAGKVYKQGLSLVNQSFKTGKIFETDNWKNLVENGKKSAIHFVGLLSDASVHGNINHLEKMIMQCNKSKVKNVYVHALLDGRDTPPQSALIYLKRIIKFLEKTNKNYKLVDFGGRNKIVMDRYEANTNIVKKGFDLFVNKVGNKCENVEKIINELYKNNVIDQEIEPYVIEEKIKINNGDSVVLFNYRGDRAMEFSQMFDSGKYIGKEFNKIDKCYFVGMMQYDGDLKIPQKFLVNPPQIKNTLTQFLIKNNVKQFSIAETQKFGHITYYFNGNKQEKISDKLETYKEIKSDKNITFNTKPEMKAFEVANSFCEAIEKNKFDFYKVNFANGDMVAHTGDFNATVKALETVDNCLGKIIDCAKKNNVVLLVLADHGNSEKMLEKNGEINSSHTSNPVYFSCVNTNKTKFKIKKGNFGLCNVANSVCVALNLGESKLFENSIIE